jgi:anaerobic selenocysteine-containing dehydrogenase/Fe-S-cluster-containing dehydrogenase component
LRTATPVLMFSWVRETMEKTTFSRRQFLKAAGVTGLTALTAGCSDATRKLIPYVTPPEDIVPGEATWYATTCRECPAGCGILAKNRDGRVIKVEGNPLHPVNTGKLCPRGQASVQGVYNPDRHRGPLKRRPDGAFAPLSWDEAEKGILNTLAPLIAKGRGRSVAFLTDLTTGPEKEMVRRLLRASGSTRHIMYEPFAYEALKRANSDVFGIDGIPAYSLDSADLLLSFGANFLETWLSNVNYARQFARFREPRADGKNPFFYVGPRLSLTAANADHWVAVPPGGESVVALGLLRILLSENEPVALGKDDAARLRAALSGYTPETVAGSTGVRKEVLAALAASFKKASRPLVLAEGMGYQDPGALETARAANLLCRLKEGSGEIIDFSSPSALSGVASAQEMKRLIDAMNGGEVGALFILRANPVFHLPPQWGFAEAVRKVGLVVSFSSFPDETDQLAHMVLPTHTFLESWGDFEPRAGVRGIMQPVMGPVFDTRLPGDVFLSLGRGLKGTEPFPEKDFYEALRHSWETPGKRAPSQPATEAAWEESLRRGGSWVEAQKPPARPFRPQPVRTLSFSPPKPAASRQQGFSFISYPTVQFFDGRMANRPFLQELPDPMTAITWSGWVEIHPDTAANLKIAGGDMVTLRTQAGTLQAAAYLYPGIQPSTLAMPIGHGHTNFGRYARSEAGNPAHISGNGLDGAGGIIRAAPLAAVTKTGGSVLFAHTDGSHDQHGREIARSMSLQEYRSSTGRSPEVVLPLSRGFSKERDFYASHAHDEYRWSMVVDLDRCIGCGACVAACYAENNVATVGRSQVTKGREMAWLHIQRYFEPTEPFVRFLPMLCQHCDEAPCESVCPVFAPNHSREGINNQVYNRCIGTRYCSQNCPYKVRRFNWFQWKHDAPLEWQLNPDVTVRGKGVMEKCSFCIQRINEARIKARSEDRAIRDGEFYPACVQTCPTDALVFGNLKNPESRVARLVREARAYQVLGDLNTKPGVIYLKKIIQSVS